MGTTSLTIAVGDILSGRVLLDAWGSHAARQSYGDTYRAIIALVEMADRLVLLRQAQLSVGEMPPDILELVKNPSLGGQLQRAKEVDATYRAMGVASHLETMYRAVLYCASRVGHSWRQVPADSEVIIPGAPELPQNPWALVVGVIGVAGVVGLTLWGKDKNEKVAEVERHVATLAHTTNVYMKDLEFRAQHNLPLPEPTPPINAAAFAQQADPWLVGGVGALIGIGAATGIYMYATGRSAPARSSSSKALAPVERENPARRRKRRKGRRRRSRKNPTTTTTTQSRVVKKTTAGEPKPKRKARRKKAAKKVAPPKRRRAAPKKKSAPRRAKRARPKRRPAPKRPRAQKRRRAAPKKKSARRGKRARRR